MNQTPSHVWPTRLRRLAAGVVLAYTAAVSRVSGIGPVVGVTIALLAFGVLAGWWAARLTPTNRARRFVRAVDVIASNVALTLVLAEAALTAYASTSANILLVKDDITTYRLLPNHDYGRLWTNSSGYPSREFVLQRAPGVTRVALLGDSFAVGSVRQDVNFASMLEALRPHVEVYNFGVHAIGPGEYRIILETEALGFDPDIVLVAFFVGNDLTEGPQRSWSWTLKDHALGRVLTRTWRVVQERFRQRFGPSPPPLLLPQLSTPVIPERGFTLSRQRYLEVEEERLGLARLSRRSMHEEGWTYALEQLRAMRDATHLHGGIYAIAIIPDEFQVNTQLLDDLLNSRAIAREDVDLELPQRRLLEFCRAESIPCLDFLPILKDRPATYLPQDSHWNELGNRLAAEALAPWLDTLRDERGGAGELRRVEDGAPLAAR